ncbi:mCG140463, isoform CRA_b [Mus musculus]|nr:mCG140463, isoform CRA_b [Mus musculus]
MLMLWTFAVLLGAVDGISGQTVEKLE